MEKDNEDNKNNEFKDLYNLSLRAFKLEAKSLIAKLEGVNPDNILVDLYPPIDEWDFNTVPNVEYKILKNNRVIKYKVVPFEDLRKSADYLRDSFPMKFSKIFTKKLNLKETLKEYYISEDEIKDKLSKMYKYPPEKIKISNVYLRNYHDPKNKIMLIGYILNNSNNLKEGNRTSKDDNTENKSKDNFKKKSLERIIPFNELCLGEYYSDKD